MGMHCCAIGVLDGRPLQLAKVEFAGLAGAARLESARHTVQHPKIERHDSTSVTMLARFRRTIPAIRPALSAANSALKVARLLYATGIVLLFNVHLRQHLSREGDRFL